MRQRVPRRSPGPEGPGTERPRAEGTANMSNFKSMAIPFPPARVHELRQHDASAPLCQQNTRHKPPVRSQCPENFRHRTKREIWRECYERKSSSSNVATKKPTLIQAFISKN